MTKGSMGSEKSLHSSSSRGFGMRIKTILPLVATLALSVWLSAHGAEKPNPTNAEAATPAEAKAKAVPGVTDVKVEVVWDPPWDPSRMSDAAKLQLGML